MTPAPVLVNPAWFDIPNGLDGEVYLLGIRCRQCGKSFFPPRARCPRCLAPDTAERVRLSRRGTLADYFIAQVAPTGFKPPYIGGHVDLPEGIRLYAQISGVEPKEGALQPGQPVELVVERLYDDATGNPVLGYKFRPAAAAKRRSGGHE